MSTTVWEEVLVIILSAALAIFLGLAITATIKIIQILNYVKRITQRAENIAHKAEEAAEFMKHTASTKSVFSTIGNIVGSYKEQHGKTESKK